MKSFNSSTFDAVHGTVMEKIRRVAGDLLRHPRYIPRCLAHNLINGKTPLDLELPWFSYAAIDFLDEYVQPDMSVCEYGSGGSTFFFARRAKSVFSIEDQPKWFEWVSQRLRQRSVSNVKLVLCPFDFKNPAGFERSAYLHAIPEQAFDIMVVDGSKGWTPARPLCFQRAQDRVKRPGIVVVDDSWRYPELRQRNLAKGWRVFQSVGPCRRGVTTTDIFFY